MGQYYEPVLIDESGIHVYDIGKIDAMTGYKLMEHSWISNSSVNSIARKILDNPMHVIWMGDYGDDDPRINEISQGMDAYVKAWKNNEKELIECDPVDIIEDGPYYLVNYTKKEFVDMDDYISKMISESDMCVHPLPLLTAVGNGQGGGDYYGRNEDSVGYWAGDLIELTKSRPETYALLDTDMIGFFEEY